MKIGFYAGSFDPFTNGHLHVVKRSAELFDKVIIGIGINSQKSRRYHQDIIKQAIEKLLKRENLDNVSVILYSDLSISIAKQQDTTFFIRGIRNGMDYDYEENIALINEELSGIDTIYIRAGKYGAISSSIVSEFMNYGQDISNLVPQEIYEIMLKNKPL
ncbi:MAG: pantetheine-phosphate adenylyltransferase [Clostridia bacterium]|nr:pantetheine-phosphate adenylyltransferase [Clostridia bacterium]